MYEGAITNILSDLYGPAAAQPSPMPDLLRGQQPRQMGPTAMPPQPQMPPPMQPPPPQPQMPPPQPQGGPVLPPGGRIQALPQATAAQAGGGIDWAARNADLQRRIAEAEAEERVAMQPIDRTAMEETYQKRAATGQGHLLKALAAVEAGKDFAPISQHFLRASEEAVAPMKMAGGTMTEQGFIADPGYESELRMKRAQAKIAQLEKIQQFNLTLEERARAQDEKQRWEAQFKQAQLDNTRLIAGIVAASKKGSGDGGDGGDSPGKASYVGVDAQTGRPVIEDKFGRHWLEGAPEQPGGLPTHAPFQGELIPKVTHEKNVAAGTELAQSVKGTAALLDTVKNNPNAFGTGAAVSTRVPAIGGLRTAVQRATGVSGDDVKVRARFMRDAALEMNRLYGAAQSQGEGERAKQFIIDKDDDIDIVMAKLEGARDYASDAFKRWGPAAQRSVKERTGIDVNAPPPAPAPKPQAPTRVPKEGDTASGPNGQKVRLTNGKWVPV